MYQKPPPSQMLPAPHKAATSFKYVSDGSGRDFYITFNSGGLEAPYIPGLKHPSSAFFQSLRNNRKIIKYKRHISPKDRDLIKRCRSSQRELVERLTANNSKWKEMTEAHRRSTSRRRGSSTSFHRPQASISNDSRNKFKSHNTINNTSVADLKKTNTLINNEYDDQQKLRPSNSFSVEKMNNINISKCLQRQKNKSILDRLKLSQNPYGICLILYFYRTS